MTSAYLSMMRNHLDYFIEHELENMWNVPEELIQKTKADLFEEIQELDIELTEIGIGVMFMQGLQFGYNEMILDLFNAPVYFNLEETMDRFPHTTRIDAPMNRAMYPYVLIDADTGAPLMFLTTDEAAEHAARVMTPKDK